MEPWGAAKKLLVNVAVSPAPVRVPRESPLVPSVASVTSVANDVDSPHPFLLSFYLAPDVLCNPTDLIWRKGTPFEAMTGRTAPS